MKKVCYTINFGNYDILQEPKVITPGWDYVCITDNPKLKTKWDILHYDNDMPRWLIAREAYIKHNKFLKDYDLSIMVGGQYSVNVNLDEWMKNRISDSADMALAQHNQRFCVYREIDACVAFNKMTDQKRIEIYKKYISAGLQEEFGLVQCGVIIRKHNRPNLDKFSDLWFEETKFTTRDQVSFMYTYFKHRIISYNLFSAKEFGRKIFNVGKKRKKIKK